MNNRINAFTLVELLIGMIFTSILIVSISAFYLLSNKQLRNKIMDANYLKERIIINDVIENDFHKALNIKFLSEKSIAINFKETVIPIKYQFTDSLIIREFDSNKDSFNVTLKSLFFSFNGNRELSPNQLIDYISFDISFYNRFLNCVYTKNYSSELKLMQEL